MSLPSFLLVTFAFHQLGIPFHQKLALVHFKVIFLNNIPLYLVIYNNVFIRFCCYLQLCLYSMDGYEQITMVISNMILYIDI